MATSFILKEIEQERMTCESLDALRLSRAILGSVATLSRVCLLLICNVCPAQKSMRRNFENGSHVWKANKNIAEEVFPVTSPTEFQKKDSVGNQKSEIFEGSQLLKSQSTSIATFCA